MPERGDEIPGYRIITPLPGGGMSEVYLAEDLGALRGKRVALKVLSKSLSADETFRMRFKNEARILVEFDDPHVIPIYGYGETPSGRLFLAMRYVEGSDLAKLIDREGQLSLARVCEFIYQIGGALHSAHLAGIVHRDVKPSNVLIQDAGTDDEHLYLTDFGIAKDMKSDAGFTTTGSFFGTTQYAAPEQIEAGHLDGRTDIYALGGLAFHCLVGSVPYPRPSDMETLWAHLKADPPSVRSLRPDLPSQVDQVIRKAMAKDPSKRQASCLDFRREFQAAIAGTDRASEETLPATQPAPKPRTPNRSRNVLVVIGLLVLLAMAGLLWRGPLSRDGMGEENLSRTPSLPTFELDTPSPLPLTPGPDRAVVESVPNEPDASEIAAVLADYYTSINTRDFASAWRLTSSRLKQERWGAVREEFEEEYEGAKFSRFEMRSVVPNDDRLAARLMFREFADPDASAGMPPCRQWDLNFVMKLFAGRWLIDDIRRGGVERGASDCQDTD